MTNQSVNQTWIHKLVECDWL